MQLAVRLPGSQVHLSITSQSVLKEHSLTFRIQTHNTEAWLTVRTWTKKRTELSDLRSDWSCTSRQRHCQFSLSQVRIHRGPELYRGSTTSDS